jgi:putative ABC transport system substrate-binding protein
VVPPSSDAQQVKTIPRIGILWGGSPPSEPAPSRDAFRQGLRELGYAEGQNIALEERWAERQPERLPALAAELVHLQVDVLVTTGDAQVRAAKHATSTIPIVMAVSGAPVEAGYVTSLARPGGNITGLSVRSPELSAKLLELLKEAVPNVARVAVLWNAANPVKVLDFRETQDAARVLGVTLQSVEVRAAHDFEVAFAAITRERPDAFIALVDEFSNQHSSQIGGFAARSRLPAIFGDRRHVEAGGLMSYGPSLRDMFRRAATLVDKILKGAKPADLPVEQPTKFELVLNRKTAQVLGITFPPTLLVLADEVIQ